MGHTFAQQPVIAPTLVLSQELPRPNTVHRSQGAATT